MSDVIMFSAAYTKQGGNNHINEQPHTYWAKKFISHDFVPYDIFRPVFWGIQMLNCGTNKTRFSM